MIYGENKRFKVIRVADNDAWLNLRREGIGGSDVAAIAGKSPWHSPQSTYLDKIGNPLPDDLSESDPVSFGNDFEQTVIRHFAKANPQMIVRRVNAVLRSIDHPWMQASLDGEVRENGEWGILEIKCPSSIAKWNEGIPVHYLLQVMHYMAVTGRNFAWICAFARDSCTYHQYRVERDPELVEDIEKTCDNFWNEHVLKRVPPVTVTCAPDEARAIHALHPEVTFADFVNCKDDANVAAMVVGLENAKEAERVAHEDRVRYTNALMQVIGDNKGVLTSNARVTWSRGTVKKVDLKRLKALYPDVYDDCLDTVPRNNGLRVKMAAS